ncbi:MAG: cyclic nucleotide-gated ion channel, partial [Beijerinckiaceae bacterium]
DDGDGLLRLRRRVHELLDYGFDLSPAGAAAHYGLMALVFISVAAGVVSTVPQIWAQWSGPLQAIEAFALFVFALEYALRFWSAPEHTLYAELHPWRARLSFALEPMSILDLVTLAPLLASVFVESDLSVFLMLRLLRYFKLARYSPGMRSLALALQTERRALGASLLLLIGLVILSASVMHVLERDAQPDKFGSVPEAMWWAIVTLTTVGYGDVTPVTAAGRLVAGVTMVMGMIMLALPVGIVATAFSQEIHRREFVVTWGMLSRVPLFAHLSAAEIAEIMRYLRAQTIPANTLVMRRGDAATCMYLIASGEVEIDAPGGPVRLGEGDFFGELALLRQSRRSADVRSVKPTKLLALDAADMMALMDRDPGIRAHIMAQAAARSAP